MMMRMMIQHKRNRINIYADCWMYLSALVFLRVLLGVGVRVMATLLLHLKRQRLHLAIVDVLSAGYVAQQRRLLRIKILAMPQQICICAALCCNNYVSMLV
jgi:hypothetical protein